MAILPREYKSHLIISAILLGILVIIALGWYLAPHLFYNQWIWKYYWGPVVADAAGHSVTYQGISAEEGYTLISEITYGLILIGALYGLYKLLKQLQVKINWSFCVALLPYILFGPVTRVLEDTGYFSEPAVYWFISPLLYLQTTLYVLFFLSIGYFLEKNAEKLRKNLLVVLLVFFSINLLYYSLWLLHITIGVYTIDPLTFCVLSACAFLPLLYYSIKKKKVYLNAVVFAGGLLVLLPAVYLILRWVMGFSWGPSEGVFLSVLLFIFGIVSLIVVLVYLVSWRFRRNKVFSVYSKPLNLSMLTGHLIDGFTSYISIYDPLHMGLPSYIEKHPASNSLMVLWPPLFPIVKFLLIIIVIYLFDVLYKKELFKYIRLMNLLKIGIFILGVSPGLRDLLRVTMGV